MSKINLDGEDVKYLVNKYIKGGTIEEGTIKINDFEIMGLNLSASTFIFRDMKILIEDAEINGDGVNVRFNLVNLITQKDFLG